ncbi:protein-L-isoaspartate(D-aspartate) O-methyltransferase [Desulfuromonas acetoxidans]|uniref:Protein-L-isoaspartate O-methyltransferase n=1 Tax=Desulfuromonas acetoxidans (strain DSM 684 / 11070) TaxID=281689 RepID=Q1JYK4_DESA6|nr:protein-L-isoaspartate(D-aspartate) O-methyltransferase [Desulfuromonas acetoxidans]EAT15411.1 protein-L-isoaspartate O-methyltransferase [Desulfuromonas acetoxidans DSM 684]MBF0646178.1 protein-L-isoaspartate(D-aspartate) O-methyltransferase [Desulfuromonas acetoxidans]NVD24443.1 protein-L-isoaspartate(D-aspartate) O-methyltransferase [Desulfuromonas acetoxidans]NVE16609.1 protein-L-isoaspartate(D-aspartate) O-methyltransferase [Desulfuromonas acetoxidans]
MDYSIARRRMVAQHIVSRGIHDADLIHVMEEVPRHLFVEEALQSQAYTDYALPIGEKQTISQPYMVAVMTEALQLKRGDRVLEVGTGSGYQAAVLSRLVAHVYSVERIATLARRARRILDKIGSSNVHIQVADGTTGWRDQAPFDGIIVTAGAPQIPQDYLDQLVVGGRLIIPVGDSGQQVLKRVTRVAEQQFDEEEILPCRFVPLIGEHGWSQ